MNFNLKSNGKIFFSIFFIITLLITIIIKYPSRTNEYVNKHSDSAKTFLFNTMKNINSCTSIQEIRKIKAFNETFIADTIAFLQGIKNDSFTLSSFLQIEGSEYSKDSMSLMTQLILTNPIYFKNISDLTTLDNRSIFKEDTTIGFTMFLALRDNEWYVSEIKTIRSKDFKIN